MPTVVKLPDLTPEEYTILMDALHEYAQVLHEDATDTRLDFKAREKGRRAEVETRGLIAKVQ